MKACSLTIRSAGDTKFTARTSLLSVAIIRPIISYVLINLVCGKAKKLAPLMYILAVLFVLKYIFLS